MKVRDITKPEAVTLGSLRQGLVYGSGFDTWMVCGWDNVNVSRRDTSRIMDNIKERVVVNVVSGELAIEAADRSVMPCDAELVLSRA